MKKQEITFRLFPTEEQKKFFDKNFFCSRFIYEYFIKRIQYDEEVNDMEFGKEGLTEWDYDKKIPELKKFEEYSFLREADSRALQGAMTKLFRDVWMSRKNHRKKYPEYKLPVKEQNSYTTVKNKDYTGLYISSYGLKLPKIEYIQINQTRRIPYNWKIAKVKVYQTKTDRYYATITFDIIENTEEKPFEE